MEEKETRNSPVDRFHMYSFRCGELSVGLAIKYLSDKAFDYLLYPFLIFKLGVFKGGIIMTLLAFFLNIATMIFYDWSKRDWLGIEAIKNLKEYAGKKAIGRITSWLLKRGDPAIFLYLSIQHDPFITTAYMRKGANQFNGMSKRDWTIFMGSLLISNAYWTLACFMGITVFEWGWKAITKS